MKNAVSARNEVNPDCGDVAEVDFLSAISSRFPLTHLSVDEIGA